MRPLSPLAVALLVLCAALAGCASGERARGQDDGDGDDGGGGPATPRPPADCPDDPAPSTGSAAPSATAGPGNQSFAEDDGAVLHVTFESDCPATLEVPLPTLDSCRSPEDWLAGAQASGNATARLRELDPGGDGHGRSGRVLAVTGQGSVTWSSQIAAGEPCQTLRHDPWSVDPDPEEGFVEVRSGGWTPAHATVLVRLVRGGCGTATLYEGAPQDGWAALEGRSLPVGC